MQSLSYTSFTVQARSRYKLSENKFYFALFHFSDRLVGTKPSWLWIPQHISALRTRNSDLKLWNDDRRSNTSGPKKHENHVQYPQTNWNLGQISCNNMSSCILIKGIKERLMMMDLVTQMDKAKECVNFALTHQAISKEDKE